MNRGARRGLRVAVVTFVATSLAAAHVSAETRAAKLASALHDAFRMPERDFRPIVRWWWLGASVSTDEIERELTEMRDAGFGGVEIQVVASAGMPGAADQSLPFLSQDFLNALAFAGATARELGLTIDVVPASGWPWGGPHIKRALGARRLGSEPAQWPQGSPTLAESSFAVQGAAGLVLDPFDTDAVALQLATVGDGLMRVLGEGPRAVVADRLDSITADWTADLPAQFQKRRGYDVAGLLYSLSSREADTADLRHDYALTLAELLDERYYGRLHEWSQRRHVQLRAALASALPATLTSLRWADLPEGQGLPWNRLVGTRWASSAAHVFGKPASAVLWTESPPAFAASPLDLKVDADQTLLAGATSFVGQGWPYSPPEAEAPGWFFDGTAAVSHHNPWWPVMSELLLYLRRATFVVRQGEPVVDVAVYLPTHDALSALGPGDVHLGKAIVDRVGPDLIPAILAAGFSFDVIDDGMLQSMADVRGRVLRIGEAAYGVVVLPDVERIPAETLAKLEAFASGGGTVIATGRLPGKLPGAHPSKADDEKLRTAVGKLFSEAHPACQVVRDEKGELGSVLRKALDPDVRTAIVSPHLGFVHRKTGELDYYFLVNTANLPYENAVEFRVASRSAEWWDPLSGETIPAQVQPLSPASTRVLVSLPAYGSRVLVFGLQSHERSGKAGPGRKSEPAGPSLNMDLSNGWDVTFQDSTLQKHMDWLSSWTESADTRAFSGEAIYRKTILIKQPPWLTARRVVLAFGDSKPSLSDRAGARAGGARLEAPVREAAIVFINGQRAGSTWCPPYRVDVGKLLREGTNLVEIHVYNLASNQLAGRPRARRQRPIDAGDAVEGLSRPLPVSSPAGLLGPLTLTTQD